MDPKWADGIGQDAGLAPGGMHACACLRPLARWTGIEFYVKLPYAV